MQVRVVGWHIHPDAARCSCGASASVWVVATDPETGYDDWDAHLCSNCLKQHEVTSDAIDEVFRKAGF